MFLAHHNLRSTDQEMVSLDLMDLSQPFHQQINQLQDSWLQLVYGAQLHMFACQTATADMSWTLSLHNYIQLYPNLLYLKAN